MEHPGGDRHLGLLPPTPQDNHQSKRISAWASDWGLGWGLGGQGGGEAWCTWFPRASREPRVLAASANGGDAAVGPPPACQLVGKAPGCFWAGLAELLLPIRTFDEVVADVSGVSRRGMHRHGCRWCRGRDAPFS